MRSSLELMGFCRGGKIASALGSADDLKWNGGMVDQMLGERVAAASRFVISND